MHDTKAFISKGFKNSVALEIKVNLGTTKSLKEWLKKISKIILKTTRKKLSRFWLQFKLTLTMGLFPRNKFMGK